jgi:hypothetical protein
VGTLLKRSPEITEARKLSVTGARKTEPVGSGPAALAAFAAGFIMLTGALIDLGSVWLFQRESSPQWEFVAISNTVESVPRMLFAIAFLFLALHLRATVSMAGYRVLASIMVFLGAASAALGALAAMSYFALAPLVTQPAVYTAMRGVAMKTIGLSVLYAIVAIPIGIYCMRRPRG